MDSGRRKRGRPEAAFSGNGGLKKSKGHIRALFWRYMSLPALFPGYSAHTQLANLAGNNAVHAERNASFPDAPAPAMKMKLCNKVNTTEGCNKGTNAILPTDGA